MMRTEYLKNFERMAAVRQKRTQEHEKDWRSVQQAKANFSQFQNNEVQTVKDKEAQFRQELADMIK